MRWFVEAYGGKMSEQYIAYMSEEWGVAKRGDRPLFEKLCLEGAQAGLSWATILAKRDNYRRAFNDFDIDACAAMTEEDVVRLANDRGIVRSKPKIRSVISNAKLVQEICQAPDPPEHGHFDALLWSYVDFEPVLNAWPTSKEIPCETDAARRMAADLKARGFKFVGPKICYSLMQSCGLVVDHPVNTPEWIAARDRLSSSPDRKKRKVLDA